ncbi:MAG: HEAT repeat domain-containing protein [Elusimicrobiota bacterium]
MAAGVAETRNRKLQNILHAVREEKNPSLRRDAVDALGKMGAIAVPGLTEVLKDSDPRIRFAAAEALERLGPVASAAASMLVEVSINDGSRGLCGPGIFPSTCFTTAELLSKIGPSAKKAVVPSLVEALKNDNAGVRFWAIYSLEKMGPIAREAIPALAEAIKDSDSSVRFQAVGALVKVGPNSPETVPALVVALSDNYIANRKAAVGALAELGPAGKNAAAELVEALKDDELADAAAKALGKMGSAAKEAVPALIERFKEDGQFRSRSSLAIEILSKIGSPALPALLEALKDPNASVRRCAAESLGGISPATKTAVQALAVALKDDDPNIRTAASMALGKIGPTAKDAVPPLVAALKDQNREVRVAAVSALGDIGPEAAAAVPFLVEGLSASHRLTPAHSSAEMADDWGSNARDALVKIGPASVSALVTAMKSTNVEMRNGAASALNLMGASRAKAAAPALAELSKTEWNPKVKESMLDALDLIRRGCEPPDWNCRIRRGSRR